VKRVSGVNFKVEYPGRRAGDPVELVAACDRIRATLDWQPHFNDLQTIVSHALTWERKLSQRASCEKRAGATPGPQQETRMA
jgi:UDP-glucose 4-epimerase